MAFGRPACTRKGSKYADADILKGGLRPPADHKNMKLPKAEVQKGGEQDKRKDAKTEIKKNTNE